jgi:hypothetical protein
MTVLVDALQQIAVNDIKGSLNNIRWFALGAAQASREQAFHDIYYNLGKVIDTLDENNGEEQL